MFSFLFGKKSTSPSPKQTIDKLRETLNMLEKRETFLEREITILRDTSKKYLQENLRTKALNNLKKAKLLEKELESINGQKFNLDIQISALTQAITNSETINAMKIGKNTLSVLETKNDPDKVSETIDDISEQIAKVDEISETMARPIRTVIDEDELLEELNQLSVQKCEKSNKDIEISDWPEVPQNKLTLKEYKEKKELEELDDLLS